MFDNLAVGKKRKSFHKIVDDNYMNAWVNKLINLSTIPRDEWAKMGRD